MERQLYPITVMRNALLLLIVVLLNNFSFTAHGQNIDFGKSYINVTKGSNGGTVEPGDTLEIRASFVVRSGTYDSCGYFDAVPAGTAFIPGTIRVLTNEGKIYKQFTDAYGDDCGWISISNIRINLGYVASAAPATAFRRGRVVNTHKPSFYGSTCIMVASFRVRVTAAYGTTISIGGGSMTYKQGASTIQTFNFPANTVMVYRNFGICPNSVGTNSLGTEFNGTFGSGQPRNRGSSANVPVGYTYQVFTTNAPNDYSYGVVNNTSTRTAYTTSDTWPKPDPDPDGAGPLTTHRVFQVWDIIGDHTGAISPTVGNPAADTVANPNAGYMLVINAAYRIDSAFQHTISGLCPNTYYEISCWMRNICSKCGCDSNGVGATGGAGYIPTAPGDSAGVRPNITFEVDGIDYYTTGNILYTGQWVKKGFTFLTAPSQTSFTLKFFNNAPGGGGNDWALDDISVATCSPNLQFFPSPNPTVCYGNPVYISATVKCFFNNYVYYKWQKSTDNGATWTDDGAPGGPASPAWSGTDWQYTVNYPPFVPALSDSGTKYRLVIATTLSNLSNPSCSFSESTVITLHVLDCSDPLAVQFLSFNGSLNGTVAQLKWSTTQETGPVSFAVERSSDGVAFTAIGTVSGYNNSSGINNYSFDDNNVNTDVVYYRIKMIAGQSIKFSRIIRLSKSSTQQNLQFTRLINPFDQLLQFEIISSKTGKAEIELVRLDGKVAKKKALWLAAGYNAIEVSNTSQLTPGIYCLQLKMDEVRTQKLVMKK